MNFLIKIEEALDKLILKLVEKAKAITPSFVFNLSHWMISLPALIKKTIQALIPKLRIYKLKLIGYSQHYLTLLTGHFVGYLIYLRSEEFKKKDKVEIVLTPLRKFKTDPKMAFGVTTLLAFLIYSGALVYRNTEKIVIGTKALRVPASARETEDPVLEFRKLNYQTKLPAGQEIEVTLNVTILAKSHDELDLMIKQEEKILEHLENFPIKVDELPLKPENQKMIEDSMIASLQHGLHLQGMKSLSIKQILGGRPKYFMQTERQMRFSDLNLQIFLEDTRRNRQVWLDFTVQASNRNIIIYLKDHLVQVQDHLNTNVEPVIPRLPLEDEGRQIIKEKLKSEINELLKQGGVEGKILEVYLDYLIVS